MRIAAEQQHCGVGRFSVVEQVEVGEQGLRRSVGLEGKATLAAGGFQEPVDTFAGEIFQIGLIASGGVKRRDTQRADVIEIVHEAGVDLGCQGADVFDRRRISSPLALPTSFRILGARIFSSEPHT